MRLQKLDTTSCLIYHHNFQKTWIIFINLSWSFSFTIRALFLSRFRFIILVALKWAQIYAGGNFYQNKKINFVHSQVSTRKKNEKFILSKLSKIFTFRLSFTFSFRIKDKKNQLRKFFDDIISYWNRYSSSKSLSTLCVHYHKGWHHSVNTYFVLISEMIKRKKKGNPSKAKENMS